MQQMFVREGVGMIKAKRTSLGQLMQPESRGVAEYLKGY